MLSVHTRTALDHIRRFPFQALAVILVFVNAFFVITILVVLLVTTNNLLRVFETRPQIIAFLNKDIDQSQVESVRSRFSNDERVSELIYISQEEAFEIYRGAGDYNPLLEELVNPSVFPASLEFTLTDLTYAEAVIEEIKAESIVDEVNFTANLGPEDELVGVVQSIRRVSSYIRNIGGGFVVFQIIASFIVLLVIISIRMTVRKSEIEILRLLGATNWFIKFPMIIEAMFYTISGAIFGWILALLLFLYTSPSVLPLLTGTNIEVLPTSSESLIGLFGPILLAELIIAIVLGLFGSLLAASRVKSYV